jgi:hypothetical protein
MRHTKAAAEWALRIGKEDEKAVSIYRIKEEVGGEQGLEKEEIVASLGTADEEEPPTSPELQGAESSDYDDQSLSPVNLPDDEEEGDESPDLRKRERKNIVIAVLPDSPSLEEEELLEGGRRSDPPSLTSSPKRNGEVGSAADGTTTKMKFVSAGFGRADLQEALNLQRTLSLVPSGLD